MAATLGVDEKIRTLGAVNGGVQAEGVTFATITVTVLCVPDGALLWCRVPNISRVMVNPF